jgi:hypothetical protein
MADLGHDRVAGVDAHAALDAAELNAIADIHSRGAGVDALVAVDAVAGGRAAQVRVLGLFHHRPITTFGQRHAGPGTMNPSEDV